MVPNESVDTLSAVEKNINAIIQKLDEPLTLEGFGSFMKDYGSLMLEMESANSDIKTRFNVLRGLNRLRDKFKERIEKDDISLYATHNTLFYIFALSIPTVATQEMNKLINDLNKLKSNKKTGVSEFLSDNKMELRSYIEELSTNFQVPINVDGKRDLQKAMEFEDDDQIKNNIAGVKDSEKNAQSELKKFNKKTKEVLKALDKIAVTVTKKAEVKPAANVSVSANKTIKNATPQPSAAAIAPQKSKGKWYSGFTNIFSPDNKPSSEVDVPSSPIKLSAKDQPKRPLSPASTTERFEESESFINPLDKYGSSDESADNELSSELVTPNINEDNSIEVIELKDLTKDKISSLMNGYLNIPMAELDKRFTELNAKYLENQRSISEGRMFKQPLELLANHEIALQILTWKKDILSETGRSILGKGGPDLRARVTISINYDNSNTSFEMNIPRDSVDNHVEYSLINQELAKAAYYASGKLSASTDRIITANREFRRILHSNISENNSQQLQNREPISQINIQQNKTQVNPNAELEKKAYLLMEQYYALPVGALYEMGDSVEKMLKSQPTMAKDDVEHLNFVRVVILYLTDWKLRIAQQAGKSFIEGIPAIYNNKVSILWKGNTLDLTIPEHAMQLNVNFAEKNEGYSRNAYHAMQERDNHTSTPLSNKDNPNSQKNVVTSTSKPLPKPQQVVQAKPETVKPATKVKINTTTISKPLANNDKVIISITGSPTTKKGSEPIMPKAETSMPKKPVGSVNKEISTTPIVQPISDDLRNRLNIVDQESQNAKRAMNNENLLPVKKPINSKSSTLPISQQRHMAKPAKNKLITDLMEIGVRQINQIIKEKAIDCIAAEREILKSDKKSVEKVLEFTGAQSIEGAFEASKLCDNPPIFSMDVDGTQELALKEYERALKHGLDVDEVTYIENGKIKPIASEKLQQVREEVLRPDDSPRNPNNHTRKKP